MIDGRVIMAAVLKTLVGLSIGALLALFYYVGFLRHELWHEELLRYFFVFAVGNLTGCILARHHLLYED